VLVWHCPWIDADPQPVDPASVQSLVEDVRARGVDRALVLTSFHQSPLPLALLLRMAGVRWVGATSEDFPGTLLDLRHRLPETGLHEVERSLALAAAAGYHLPDGDDGALRVRTPHPDTSALTGRAPYVVLHPGASVPARAASPAWCERVVRALVDAGHRVVVTGGPSERALTAHVAGDVALDLGGATDLAGLAAVLAGAQVVVVGNTGPAHLAAAVGTPVVSLFSPVVPAERWRPWRVRHALLGDQAVGCALTRARECPVPGHPCLDGIPPARVVRRFDRSRQLRRSRRRSASGGRASHGRGGARMRIAMVSEHASPLATLGGVDAGGQNVHVAALAEAMARQGAEVVVHTRRDDVALPRRVRMAPA
jgi:ADP-heptose:LPS heptosyltransferase